MTTKPKTTKPAPEADAHSGNLGEVVSVPVSEIRANPRNPRKHPEKQIESLMASLRLHGQYKPVLVRKANQMLIAGHGIWTAARRLQWTHIDVRYWDIDQPTADQAMLADNRLADNSQMDERRAAEILREISETNWLATGFDQEDAAKLLKGVQAEDLRVYEVETATVTDDFWFTVRGPLAEQARVLQRAKTLLAEFGFLKIEIGTVEDH